ncbi:CHRD domain-containing protein [Halomarina litorea]|uniref:CHRD domain-containing protein n=1 Tax=Halomarina litorea TaxID=2961595 RepID=UPI0020C2C3A6|nr:CHRD domain-containing protein [Halomarina sp. BCD28]
MSADEDSRTEVGALFSSGRLLGANEVPPVDSPGDGAAVVAVSPDGDELQYFLYARNTERVTQAHIHVGGPDENGSVVLFLFGREDEDGRFVGALDQGVTSNGLLASGTLSADDLVGPLADADSLDSLLEEMRSGNAYVNVHTAATPGGEIREQVRPVDTVEVEFEEEVTVTGTSGLLDFELETELEIEEDGESVGGVPDSGDGSSDDGE